MPRLNNFLYKHSIREKIGVGYNNYTKRLLQVKKKKKKTRKRKRKKKTAGRRSRGGWGEGAMVIYHQPPLSTFIFFSKLGAEIC